MLLKKLLINHILGDGSPAGDPKICGAGGLLFIFDEHFFTFKVGLGPGTKNYAELLGLKLLLTLSLENNFKKLQTFGDSQLVINWVSGKYRIQNVQLAQILLEVNRLADMFDSVDFLHIYHERNTLVDVLEKDGANVLSGSWQISEHRETECFESIKIFFKWIMLIFELFWYACNMESIVGILLVE